MYTCGGPRLGYRPMHMYRWTYEFTYTDSLLRIQLKRVGCIDTCLGLKDLKNPSRMNHQTKYTPGWRGGRPWRRGSRPRPAPRCSSPPAVVVVVNCTSGACMHDIRETRLWSLSASRRPSPDSNNPNPNPTPQAKLKLASATDSDSSSAARERRTRL